MVYRATPFMLAVIKSKLHAFTAMVNFDITTVNPKPSKVLFSEQMSPNVKGLGEQESCDSLESGFGSQNKESVDIVNKQKYYDTLFSQETEEESNSVVHLGCIFLHDLHGAKLLLLLLDKLKDV